MAGKKQSQERREVLARMEAERRRSERRRSLIIVVVVGLIVMAIAVGTFIGVRDLNQQRDAEEQAASEPVEGVQTYKDLSRNHVETEVDYPQSPPVGGDHNPAWMNCGRYPEEVAQTSAVHSLEHGAVWVTYQPDLAEDQQALLDDIAEQNDYALVSPYADQTAPVVATAWGVQLELDAADDERLATFLTKYLQGKQTPEPGAACVGGLAG